MDTKRPRRSERSKPCHDLRLTRRPWRPYPWPPDQAQPGVSKPCRSTIVSSQRMVSIAGRLAQLALAQVLKQQQPQLSHGLRISIVKDRAGPDFLAVDEHAELFA